MGNEFIFLTDGYRGGANTFMQDHMNYLIKKKQKVLLFDSNPKKTFENLNKKVLVHKLNYKYDKIKIKKKIEDRIKIQKKKIFIMITNYVILIKYYFFFKNLNKKNYRLIITLHSGIFDLNLKRYIAGFFFSLFYKSIDYLFFGSYSSKAWWQKMYPWMKIDNSKIHYNGIKLKKKIFSKKINNNIINISFAGRIVVENNPEFFIKIASEFLKLNKNVKFNIYGDGLLMKGLKEKYNKKNIIFHGWVNKDKIYKNTNIIVITSPINNFPYVALEAKSYGIPVVSCSKGDIKKIVLNGIDGYLDYSNSEKKMVMLIRKVIKNYKKFSKNSLLRSKKFELNSSCKKFWNSINA